MGFLELRRPWGFSPEARRGSQGASRNAGKEGPHLTMTGGAGLGGFTELQRLCWPRRGIASPVAIRRGCFSVESDFT